MIRRKSIEVTAYLEAFNEYFPEAKTKIESSEDGRKYISAAIPNVNLQLDRQNDWRELPVHFYSDLPVRLHDMWDVMQKRKLSTFTDYIKSLGTEFNQTLVLTKLSKSGNRYFVVTSRAKYAQYKHKHYSGYSVETI